MSRLSYFNVGEVKQLGECHSAKLSPNSTLLACCNEETQLVEVCSLLHPTEAVFALEQVKDYIWQKKVDEDGNFKLAVLHLSGLLMSYEITSKGDAKTNYQLHTLHSDDKHQSFHQKILEFDELTVSIFHQSMLVLILSSQSGEILTTLNLHDIMQGNLIDIVMDANMLYTLTEEEMYIYCINNSGEKSIICWEKSIALSQSSSHPVSLATNSQLDCIAVTYSDGRCFAWDLRMVESHNSDFHNSDTPSECTDQTELQKLSTRFSTEKKANGIHEAKGFTVDEESASMLLRQPHERGVLKDMWQFIVDKHSKPKFGLHHSTFKKLTASNVRRKQHVNETEAMSSSQIKQPENVKRVRQAAIDSNFIYLWYEEADESSDIQSKLTVTNWKTGEETDCLCLPRSSVVIFSDTQKQPNFFLTKDYLAAIVRILSRDTFVNKFMVYGSARLADKMFQLNHWQHVDLPLSVLDWGLQNHQLDTAMLFLKSHEENEIISASDKSQGPDFVRSMMELIFSVIKEKLNDSNSCLFVEQILKMALEYLIGLMSIIAISSTQEMTDELKLEFENCIGEYIRKIRKHLKNHTFQEELLLGKEIANDNLAQFPKSGNTSNLIEDAIRKRCIPAIQLRLTENLPTSEWTSSLHHITQNALNLIRRCLATGDFCNGKYLTDNLGRDMNKYLEMELRTTVERNLRKYLMEMMLLPQYDIHFNHLNSIELLYSSCSYCSSRKKLADISSFGENEVAIQFPSIPATEVILFDGEDDTLVEKNMLGPSYCNLQLDWVQAMNAESVQRVLLQGILQQDNESGMTLPKNISNTVVENYYLSYDEDNLLKSYEELNSSHLPYLPMNSASENDWTTAKQFVSLPFNMEIIKNSFQRISVNDNFPSVTPPLLFTQFIEWEAHPNDNNKIRSLSEENYNHLRKATDDQIHQFSLRNLLDFTFGSDTESEASILNITNELLDRYSWLKPITMNHLEASDVNLYLLLQNNVKFNTTQLFGWHDGDSIYCDESEAKATHFETSLTIKQNCSHQVDLDFLHYLRLGRPCYAYVQFITHEAMHGSQNFRRVVTACALATGLALHKGVPVNIVSSCIVFLELLSCDTRLLRSAIQIASLTEGKQTTPSDSSVLKENGVTVGSETSGDFSSISNLASSIQNYLINSEDTPESCSIVKQQWQWSLILNLSGVCNGVCNVNELVTSLLQNAMEYDWVVLIVIAQENCVTVEQMQSFLESCSNVAIVEHLLTAFQQLRFVTKEMFSEGNRFSLKRDTRGSLYQKIGLRKLKGEVAAPLGKKSLQESTRTFIPPIKTKSNLKLDDLFSVVLNQHDCYREDIQEVVFENPALCLQSTSEFQSALQQVEYWLTGICKSLLPTACGQSSVLESIFENCSWCLILSQGFFLFQQTSLQLLMEALTELFRNCNVDGLKICMTKFAQNLERLPTHEEECDASKILKLVFLSCDCSYRLYQLLCILKETNFPCDLATLNFHSLSLLQESVFGAKLKICYEQALIPSNTQAFTSYAILILKELLKTDDYEAAVKLQEALHLPLHVIVIFQMEKSLKRLQTSKKWNSSKFRYEFWLECQKKCRNHDIPHSIAGKFFEECAETAQSNSEKYFLLRLALRWKKTRGVEANDDSLLTLERNMWISQIEAQVQNEQFIQRESQLFFSNEHGVCHQGLQMKEVMLKDACKNLEPYKMQLKCEKAISALNKIIGDELDQNHLSQACRLASLFDVQSSDLSLVMACMDLAEGRLSPSEIELPSMARSLSHKINATVSHEDQARSDALDHIRNKCVHGKRSCTRIYNYYKIAVILQDTYKSVVSENVFILLNKLLKTNSAERINLAKQLIADNNISTQATVEFVANEIFGGLKAILSDVDGAHKLMDSLDPSSETAAQMKELLKLCQEPLLGKQLMIIANYLEETLSENQANQPLHVELYIWAHYCFSCSCSTEGIAKVLSKAHSLATVLIESSEYELLVHLLTGIGRYNEMLYVFDVLREMELFEQLLKKGMEKTHFLKISLLDYLSQFRETDEDKFMMFALNFCLYREIAKMRETVAHSKIQLIIQQEFYSDTQELERIVQYLGDASESYAKAGCPSHALNCIKLAQLVALQIYLHPSKIRILGLSNEEVLQFISTHPVFSEALLVSESHNVRMNWSTAIYYNVISQGNEAYLKDYHRALGVDEELAKELSLRLQTDRLATEKQKNHFKMVLALVPQVGYLY